MTETGTLTALPDDELLRQLKELLQRSRRTESDLVAHVGEVDRRRLYAREAAPSMFVYCTRVLHLSGAEAYLRITAARAARQHPVLLAMLADGRLHLSGIAKLAPHLTRDNRDAVLGRATHRSKREIEELVAEIAPRADVPAGVRKLSEPVPRARSGSALGAARGDQTGVRGPVAEAARAAAGDGGCATRGAAPGEERGELRGEQEGEPWGEAVAGAERSAGELRPDGVAATGIPRANEAHRSRSLELVRPATRSVVEPLAPSRYRVQFTASGELRDKLERLQALLRAELPDVDLGAVIDRAVSETLQRLEARRYGRSRTPRAAEVSAGPEHREGSRSRRAGTAGNRTTQPPAGVTPPPAGVTPSPPAGVTPSRHSRHIPAAIRRAVYERDGGRCRYVDAAGRRCPERHRLEYHHLHPFGIGGQHGLENVSLLCRAHNLLVAEHDYGRQTIDRHRRRMRDARSEPGVQDAGAEPGTG
jgi:hypothetical protein